MKITSILFCCLALFGSFLVARLAFPLAALSHTAIVDAKTPQSAELFDDIDLGDFGAVPVLDMVQYYLDNPPEPDTTSGSRKVRFQGC